MALVLPAAFPFAGGSSRRALPRLTPEAAALRPVLPLRVGIINIMPRAESYEPYLLRPLAHAPFDIEPVWLQLESHVYASSDRDHIGRFYTPFAAAHAGQALDGLIVTGAPVEELPFGAVHYWQELVEILATARREISSTLGLCWGGLALAQTIGVEKRLYPRKLFGVFSHQMLASGHAPAGNAGDSFWCAHSRHAGFAEDAVAAAQVGGQVRVLAAGAEAGPTLLESTDGRFLMHVGHPEYEPGRLVHEWERDATLGRTDVGAPANVDLRAPVDTWHDHRHALFDGWVRSLQRRRARVGMAVEDS